MRRLAIVGGFSAIVCLSASHAREIRFPSMRGLGPRAVVNVSRPTADSSPSPFAPIQVTLQMGGVELRPGTNGFDTVHVEGLTQMGAIGKPELPATGVILLVPPGMEPELSYEVVHQETIHETTIGPCQEKARCKLPTSRTMFRLDSKTYDSDQAFPPAVVRLEEVGKMQSLRLVRLAIYPLQMQMKQKRLLATTELTAQVVFRGTARRNAGVSPSFQTLARELAANGEDIVEVAATTSEPETLIVFVADVLEKTIAPLIEWKKQRGLNVEVFTYSKLGSSRDNAKKALQALYSKATIKPSYLLIVGNSKTFPGYNESTSSGSAASDYRYSLLDGKDTVPDLLYGRLLADSEAEAATQVARWIEYEKSPKGSWYPQASTIASREGTNPSDEDYANEIAKALTTHTYTKVDSFFERKKTATVSNIQDAVSEGRSWISYFGHGSGTDWASTNTYFGLDEIDEIENPRTLPFIVDVACDNASWVKLPRCFGKAWMTRESSGEPRGAIGYYGGSVSISWTEPAVMSVGVAKYHFEKPVHTMGASVLAGQIYLYEKMGVNSETTDNLEWFNLFGDPSLLLRTNTPKPYAVADQITTGSGDVQIEVRTTDAFGNGLSGVQVTAFAPSGSPVVSSVSDTNGYALLDWTGVSSVPAGAVLTTSGYNLETYQFPLQP